MDLIDHERKFHDNVAIHRFKTRRLINRLATSFYDKEIVWAPVWEELGNLSGKIVLDYGCGTGGFSFKLVQMGAIVYGIDISKEMILLAKKHICQGIRPPEFLICDAHRTSFPDAFFDVIFGNGILHHLDLEIAFREIARILKPGGRGYFMEPLALHPLLRIVRRLTPQARSGDERPLTFQDIELAKRFFSKVIHTEYFLLSVGAAPIGLLSTAFQKVIVKICHRLDRFVFWILPCTRRYAWITMIRLEKGMHLTHVCQHFK